jgi:clostripain
LIYSHANGQTMCPDEQSKHDLGIAQVTDVVSERESVDFLALELCNMAGIEIAYQWRPGNGGFSANTLVAIPNAGPPLDWNRAFARIRSPGHATTAEGPTLDPAVMTAEDFGRLVIEEGEKGRREAAKRRPERVAHEAAACYDLHAAEDVKRAVDAFVVALAHANAKEIMGELRGPGQHATVMNYVGGELGSRAYVDLFDLARRAAGCERLDAASRAAAREVMDEVDQLVLASFGMSGYPGFAPGQNGVFINFPDGDAMRPGPLGSPTRVWAAYSWYTPNRGHDVNEYGHWAWCADGAVEGNGVVENWFELMDSWYDTLENGGANGYRP